MEAKKMQDQKEAIVQKLRSLDFVNDAEEIGKGTSLIAAYKRIEEERAVLDERAQHFLAGTTPGPSGNGHRKLTDRAHDVLADHGGPLHYREIGDEIVRRGFRHSREPKNPKQIYDSVYSAMLEDPDRFVRVDRGVWDLRERP